MLTYYLMFLIPAIAAMANAGKTVRSNPVVWGFVGTAYTLLIGLRMSGGDWYNYLRGFERMRYLSLDEAFTVKEPGYELLNYFMFHWGWGFLALTFICAAISVTGLIVFLRRQSSPWLGLAVSVPYLVIVVYMGYMRQGVALGLVMWGITYLDRGKFLRFVVFVALAVTFHKSAILMMAFGIFQQGRGRIFKIAAVLFGMIGIWSAFVGDTAAETLYKNYVEADMQSQGALIRVLLNLLPAALLFLFRKRWKAHFKDYTFWFMIALASAASVGLVGFASTAVDRMALYFLPIQIVVFSRLPFLARNVLHPKTTTLLVLTLYLAILFVWLNYAVNAMVWIPYKNYITWALFG
jgi:hypothetical protein